MSLLKGLPADGGDHPFASENPVRARRDGTGLSILANLLESETISGRFRSL